MAASALIGIGSNLDSPQAHVNSACTDINAHPKIELINCSPWYGSKAVGPGQQSDYVNGAIEISTTLSPLHLLDALQHIEHQHGRVRSEKWGARTLDLDILWYNAEIIHETRLQVPHPRISERNFVLFPLRDIAPECILVKQLTARTLAERISDKDIWKLS